MGTYLPNCYFSIFGAWLGPWCMLNGKIEFEMKLHKKSPARDDFILFQHCLMPCQLNILTKNIVKI